MKSPICIVFPLIAFSQAIAQTVSINGSTTSSDPALFSDADAWGGTVPTFSNTTTVQLDGIAGNVNYYEVDSHITINKLKTVANVDGSFYLSSGNYTVTFDINATTPGAVNDVITFSNGSVGTFTLGPGIYDIISSSSVTGTDAYARICMVTDPLSEDPPKTFTFAAGSVVNAYTTLSLSGTVGAYGTYNVAGAINTWTTEGDNPGVLTIDWTANPYGTGGGTRTKVLVNDGGSISTGTLNLRPRTYLTIESGGKLEVQNDLNWSLSDMNPGGQLEVQTGATANIGSLIFKATSSTLIGSQKLLATGGKINVGSANLQGSLSLIEASDSGLINIGDFSASAGTLSAATNGVINVTGIGSLSSVTLKASDGGSVNFKSGSSIDVTSVTLNTSGTGAINFEKGSALNVANNFTVGGTGTINIDGDFVSSLTGTASFYSMTINQNASVVFGENATFTGNEYNRFSLSGKLIVNSGKNSIVTNQIVFWGKANYLELNGENSFITSSGSNETMLNITEYSLVNILVSETNTFGELLLQKDSKTYIDLDFASADDYISFSKATLTGGIGDVYVNNFENNRIKFMSDSIGDLNLYDFNGNVLDYELIQDTVNGGWWLNAVVPEPAEWAAIFGGLAFAFSLWRRRR